MHRRFAYIDALRGYAVVGVVLAHTAAMPFGPRGVQLFFVASAMTLLMSWRERETGSAPFFIRRAFRILPMWWLCVPLYLSAPYDWPQAIGAAFLMQAARPDWLFGPIMPGGWSVCAEAAFYCLFPLIAAVVTSLPRAVLLFAGSLVISKLWRTVGYDDALPAIFPSATLGELGNFVNYTLPTQLPAFAAGIIGYYLVPKISMLSRVAREGILLAAIAAAGWYVEFHPNNFAAFGGFFAIGAAAMANGAGRYLINPLICHMGRCSFSIYLLHFYCVTWVLTRFQINGAAALSICTLAVATAVSTLTYYAVERPMIRIGNRVARLLENTPNEISAVSTASP